MARKKQTKTPVYKKVEFDETTNEPKIVEVSADSLEAEDIFNEQVENAKRLKEQADQKGGTIKLANASFLDDGKEKAISNRQKKFKTLMTVLFFVFVTCVLAFTFYNDFIAPSESRQPFTMEQFWQIFRGSWYFILLAITALAACYIFKGLKLSIMSKQLTKKWHFGVCLRTAIVGHYYNSVTPLAVGGQPFEIYHLSKHGISGGPATALPVATYFLNQFGYGILGIISLIVVGTNSFGIRELFENSIVVSTTVLTLAIIGVVFTMIMPILIILFLMFPRFCAKIVHFVMYLGGKLRLVKSPKETTYKVLKTIVLNTRCLKKIASNPIVFLSTFIISFGEAIANSSMAFFVLKFFGFSLGEGVPFVSEWALTVLVCVILNNAVSFVPTPGNAGASELSFYALFQLKLMSGLAFPAMLTWRIISYYMYLIIGVTYNLIDKKTSKPANTEDSIEQKNETTVEEPIPISTEKSNE